MSQLGGTRKKERESQREVEVGLCKVMFHRRSERHRGMSPVSEPSHS